MGSAASSSKRDESPAAYQKRMERLPNGELKSVLRELHFGLTTGVPHPSHIDLSGVSLSLSSSRYGPEGLNVLAHYMSRNTTVQVLKLVRCDLCMHELGVLVRCLRDQAFADRALSSAGWPFARAPPPEAVHPHGAPRPRLAEAGVPPRWEHHDARGGRRR